MLYGVRLLDRLSGLKYTGTRVFLNYAIRESMTASLFLRVRNSYPVSKVG